jgi:formylglycine-generating enzyme required for sulfatase activity
MVGNVWEWVDGSVEGGQYAGRSVPASGYVSSIDEGGVALVTQGETPDPSFNDDYFWSDPTEVRGIIRGGYWGIDTDAGLYAVNAVLPPTFTGIGAGFRCVK